jgi:hypothetical protein
VHGIDGAFGWQLPLHKTSNDASMSFATADASVGRLWHLHEQVTPSSINPDVTH